MEEDFPDFSLEFNFPSIQETAEKPNEQQQQARRFPSLQEEALSLVIFDVNTWEVGRKLDKLETTPLRVVVSYACLVFSQPSACLHQAM